MPSGLEVWYSASTISGLADGATVVAWADSSGNGRDLVSWTGTPTFEANEIGGLPSVRFNANDENLQMANPSNHYFANDVYMVLRSGNGANFGPDWGAPIGVKDGNDANRTWMFQGNATKFWSSELPSAVTRDGIPIGSADNFNIGPNVGDYMVLHIAAGPNNGTQVREYIVGTRTDAWGNSRWDTAEIIAFNSSLSNSDANNVGGYLANKYGISSAYTGGLAVEYGNLQVGTGATLQDIGSDGISVAELSGGGAVVGNTTVRGQLAPGDGTTGTLTVTGNLTVDAAATMVIEVDRAKTPRHDSLAVSGNLDITGVTLNVQAVNPSDVYVIATYGGTLTGTFASANIPAAWIDYAYAGGTAIAITFPSTTTVFRFR